MSQMRVNISTGRIVSREDESSAEPRLRTDPRTGEYLGRPHLSFTVGTRRTGAKKGAKAGYPDAFTPHGRQAHDAKDDGKRRAKG